MSISSPIKTAAENFCGFQKETLKAVPLHHVDLDMVFGVREDIRDRISLATQEQARKMFSASTASDVIRCEIAYAVSETSVRQNPEICAMYETCAPQIFHARAMREWMKQNDQNGGFAKVLRENFRSGDHSKLMAYVRADNVDAFGAVYKKYIEAKSVPIPCDLATIMYLCESEKTGEDWETCALTTFKILNDFEDTRRGDHSLKAIQAKKTARFLEHELTHREDVHASRVPGKKLLAAGVKFLKGSYEEHEKPKTLEEYLRESEIVKMKHLVAVWSADAVLDRLKKGEIAYGKLPEYAARLRHDLHEKIVDNPLEVEKTRALIEALEVAFFVKSLDAEHFSESDEPEKEVAVIWKKIKAAFLKAEQELTKSHEHHDEEENGEEDETDEKPAKGEGKSKKGRGREKEEEEEEEGPVDPTLLVLKGIGGLLKDAFGHSKAKKGPVDKSKDEQGKHHPPKKH